MDKRPVRNMKVMLKPGLVIGQKYGDGRKYTDSMYRAQGKILTINDTSDNIFNCKHPHDNFVAHKDMVDELCEASVDEDVLFTAYVKGELNDAEYEKIRRGRG